MRTPGLILLITGLVIAAAGAIWAFGPAVPWLGRLPCDIAIQRGNFRFYFPIATCVVVSIVLTLVLWLVRYLSR
jgi:hypothetical protein